MPRFKQAFNFVANCINTEGVPVGAEGVTMVETFINDAANIFSDSYDEYNHLWEYLQFSFSDFLN